MSWDREMQRALQADAEKLSAETGREHTVEFFDFDEDGDEDDFDPADDCMLMADGQCMAAGSEWCDFECPHRDSEDFAGSAAWNKKHGVKP